MIVRIGIYSAQNSYGLLDECLSAGPEKKDRDSLDMMEIAHSGLLLRMAGDAVILAIPFPMLRISNGCLLLPMDDGIKKTTRFNVRGRTLKSKGKAIARHSTERDL